MSEYKCPVCGAAMWGSSGHSVCAECPLQCADKDFNSIAAAMELANVEAWEVETDEVRAYLDDTPEDCAAWEEIVDTNIAAERAVFDAIYRVLEVFGK